MTGTAKTQEKEFHEVYGMRVIQIPTNRPSSRIDQQDYCIRNKSSKNTNMLHKKHYSRHEKGQPVLIGTTSILQSEKVANYLNKYRLTITNY